MNIDLRTLALVLGLAYGLQAIIFFAQYLIEKTYRGTEKWVLGFASTAFGFFLLSFRGLISNELIVIFLGNTLLVLGSLFLYMGIMRFLDRRENRGVIYSILIVFPASYFYFTYVNNDITARSLILFVALAVLFLWSAFSLFFNKMQSITASAYFVSGVFFVQGCLSAARAVTLPFSDPIDSIFSLTAVHTAALVVPLIAGFLLTFGFIMMINQRLNGEIKEAKEDFELIFNTSPEASLIARLNDGMIVNINEGFTALTGFTRDETIGRSTRDIPIWKNPADLQKIVDELVQKGSCENFEGLFQGKDGSQTFGMLSAKIITLKDIPHMVSFTRDITDRRRAEEALRQSEARYRAVTQSANDAIITTDSAGTIVSWNQGAEKIFGYTEAEISGQPVIRLMPDRYRARHQAGMKRLETRGEPQVIGKTVELEGLRENGTEFPLDLSLAIWETAEGLFYTAILRDITERKHYQENMEYFALHDSLTGLLNRHSLEEQLNRTIARAKRGRISSLLYMDLDNFKEVNDTVGHSAGDEVLITLTNLIKAELRIEDIVFRLGGDEFAVLLEGMESHEALSAAERLRVAVETRPFELRSRIFPSSLSIGLILIDGTLTAGELLSRADTAMYQAKAQGKNRVVFFNLK